MPITALPSRANGSLGATLTDVRTAVANELSAVHFERLKDWIIALATSVGLDDGSTPDSLRALVGGAWTHATITDDTPAVVSTPRTLITAQIPDLPAIVSLPDPTTSEGWIVMIRKTAGSDGYGVFLRRNNAATDKIEGVIVSESPSPPAAGDWMIPGSNLQSFDLSSAVPRLAPIATWMIYSDGESWRFGPGTFARVLEEVSDPRDTAIDETSLIAHGTFAGRYDRPSAGSGTKERGWICTGFEDNGSGGLTPRWLPLAHVRVREVSADVTLNDHDEIVIVDTSGGDVTLTLPKNLYGGSAPSWIYRGNNEGRQILIVKKGTDTNLITIVQHDISTHYPTSTPVVQINGSAADYELPDSGSGTAALRWHLFGDAVGNWWA